MRCLSVRQPWASLIASGRKTIELRSRATSYRGPLLICASAGAYGPGPRGVTVGLVDLVDCRPAVPEDEEAACHPPAGHVAWVLVHRFAVEPVPVRGMLCLFTPPPGVAERLRPA